MEENWESFFRVVQNILHFRGFLNYFIILFSGNLAIIYMNYLFCDQIAKSDSDRIP